MAELTIQLIWAEFIHLTLPYSDSLYGLMIRILGNWPKKERLILGKFLILGIKIRENKLSLFEDFEFNEKLLPHLMKFVCSPLYSIVTTLQ